MISSGYETIKFRLLCLYDIISPFLLVNQSTLKPWNCCQAWYVLICLILYSLWFSFAKMSVSGPPLGFHIHNQYINCITFPISMRDNSEGTKWSSITKFTQVCKDKSAQVNLVINWKSLSFQRTRYQQQVKICFLSDP